MRNAIISASKDATLCNAMKKNKTESNLLCGAGRDDIFRNVCIHTGTFSIHSNEFYKEGEKNVNKTLFKIQNSKQM